MKIRTKFKYLNDLNKIASKDENRKNINGVNVFRHFDGGIFLTATNGYCFGRYFDQDGESDGNWTIDADRLIKGLLLACAGISDNAVIEISDAECVIKETNCRTKEVYLQTEDFPDFKEKELMPKRLIPLLSVPGCLRITIDKRFIEFMPCGRFYGELDFYVEDKPVEPENNCFLEKVYVLTADNNFIGAVMPCRASKRGIDKAFGIVFVRTPCEDDAQKQERSSGQASQ
jgi:hypothetical protein